MATPPIMRIPNGAIDGVNTVFTTPSPYIAGSLRVFHNGLLMRVDFADGWVELSAFAFQMKLAPQAGDTLTVYYRPS